MQAEAEELVHIKHDYTLNSDPDSVHSFLLHPVDTFYLNEKVTWVNL